MFKSHPKGEYWKCIICDDKVSNILHVILSCPLMKYFWDLVTDIMLIPTNKYIKIDLKLSFLKFYSDTKTLRKKMFKFIEILLDFTHKIIYTFHYSENQNLKSADISYEWKKNFKLIGKFRYKNEFFSSPLKHIIIYIYRYIYVCIYIIYI